MNPNLILTCFVTVYLLQLAFCIWLENLNRNHLTLQGKEVPEQMQGFIDKEKLGRINAYAGEKSRIFVIEKLVGDAILLGLIFSGPLNDLAVFSSGSDTHFVWAGLIFFLILGLFFFLVGLPFDYYHTFFVEEKYGFNRSDLKTWVLDKIKETLLSTVLLVALLAPVLWAIKAFPDYWWFWGFLIASFVQLVLVVLYPVLIAPIFNKFEPLQDENLARDVEEMAQQVGMRTQGIFQMDAGKRSTHSNAYFAGLGKARRIVLFDTLLSSLSHQEILSVLAHEMGHFKLKHILKSYLAGEAIMFGGFYLTYLMLNWDSLYQAFGFDFSQSYGILFVVGIFWRRLGFFLRPLYMFLSRRAERQADLFAVKLRQKAEPLATALKRMSEHNLSNLNPHPLYVWFYYSHPPLLERVATLEDCGKTIEGRPVQG
ncbi:MAG: M48 family metallopeptidase [Desulfomonile tiedjei]|nr:M48 family metallopeptidase [Desulfomonile tiedjei]